jgi:hypothetical protein
MPGPSRRWPSYQQQNRAGSCIRRNEGTSILINLDFQPTIIALVFKSLFDLQTLPPRRAPRYGWWETADSPKERLWLDCTRHLDYEIARDFDPDRDVASVLNRDANSSKTSFIATFFYIFSALSHTSLDPVLTFVLLEQLADDLDQKEDAMKAGQWCRELWFWSVMFAAVVAEACKPTNTAEEEQLRRRRDLCDQKIVMFSRLWDLGDWGAAKEMLQYVAWEDDEALEESLKGLWEAAVLNADTVE